MTKEDIVKAIWNELPNLSLNEAKKIYETFIDLIKDRLSRGESIKLGGLGTFTVREKKQRMGRNPLNGKDAIIKERRVVTFKPTNSFREKVNS